MKKVVNKEVTLCDNCGKEDYLNECIICGKSFCWDCQELCGKEFKHGVCMSGSGDGYYCTECLGKKDVIESPLYQAYIKIIHLRQENKQWYDNFRKRQERAETELKQLLDNKEAK